MLCVRNYHSVEGQLYIKQTNKLAEKEFIFVVTRGGGCGLGGLDEGSQKVQTSSYK